jgi:acyl transferase domain-containing protein/SAM-dependent methyltransferase
MSDASSSAVKRALLELRTLRAELDAAKQGVRAPLAIVGMALRLPGGVSDAASFEHLLFSGDDPIGDIPADRWPIDALYSPDPDAPGKMTTRQGGFIDNVDKFDAAFFGISAVEATSMDPQQRLLLELAWEAVENSGVGFDAVRSARAGVYIGMGNADYGRAIFTRRDLIDPYFATGTVLSVAAGRISYTLGLTGPALTVDTACSASLASLHLACQALRLGECDAALAGGVNLMLTPEVSMSFSKGRMMSPHDRCRTFDADADGYVRGEGGVMFLVKRLSDAEAAGDRILAVIRGSALNQDGRSSGLTAPSGPAQQNVLRAALADANVKPSDVAYVETHGTGTPLGDPIELGALSAVFAPQRKEPLLVGSLNSVIGHTEAAAGAAGIAKCLTALARGEIPANLHFERATPHIDWESARLKVVDKPTALPRTADGRSIVGVSSFGISGTNAHIVLEAPPSAPALERGMERPAHVLTLSAKNDAALDALAQRWSGGFSEDKASVGDLCAAANTGRAHFDHRLAIVGRSREDFTAALASPRAALRSAGVAARPQIAFLYTGQGANFPGMGRTLYETSPIFRAAIEACRAAAAPHLKRDLIEVMFGDDPAILDDTTLAQPATFALQVALTELWRSWGVDPSAALGHSLGEYAAAWAGGVFSLEDAMALVAARGRAAALVEGKGAMAAVYASPTETAGLLKSYPDVEIAVYNGPEHCVVSGPPAQVSALVAQCEADGRRARVLKIPFASHARTVEPALPALAKAFEGVSFNECAIALASNVTGQMAAPAEMSNARYWLTQMRQPVRFADALNALAAQGVTHFIELGPHPSLLAVGVENLGEDLAWLPSMRRDGDPWTDLSESLARLYVDGADIDWRGFERGYARARVAGPTYPFQRQRFWIDAGATAPGADAKTAWARVGAAAETQSAQGPLGLDPASYPQKWDELALYFEAPVIALLLSAGLFVDEDRHTLEAITARAGIMPGYVDLMDRWLGRLVAAGHLRRDGAAYAGKLAPVDFAVATKRVRAAVPDNPEMLAYVENCGALLAEVVTGRESALETLFPGGDFELAQALYRGSTTMRYMNALAGAAISAFATASSAGRPLRVLEVGAGTGGTTSAALPALAGRSNYLFTDVSDIFLDRAREVFGDDPTIRFGRFDVDQDIVEQGFAPESFDLIVSANAVHACVDLAGALSRLRSLLAPGGVLALVESTTPFVYFDYTTRLIEGWRAYNDELRKDDEPLLPPETWSEALDQAGFERVDFWPRRGAAADTLGQHLILAQAPGEFGSGASVAVGQSGAEHANADIPVASVIDEIFGAPESEKLDLMRTFVRDQVMAILRLSADEPPGRHSRLTDLGLDSLMAVQLRNRLGRGLAMAKAPAASVMFDYPTIDALAQYLLSVVAPVASNAVAETKAPAPATASALSTDAVAALDDAALEALLDARAARRPT